jgi:TatD DNase family protein
LYGLIDTHTHLEEIENLGKAITEAKAANVVAIIAVGSDFDSNQQVLEIAAKYSGFIYPALGLHPQNLHGADIEQNLHFIEKNINTAVGIGEIGLDYHKRVRVSVSKEYQISILKELLRLAKQYAKPAIIHSRYAWRDAFNTVFEAQVDKAIFHWYTGTTSVLRDIINQGYYLSATPAIEYHEEHRRAIKETPLDKLLLETDSPVIYRRGSDYEYESRPADVLRVLKGIVELRGIDENKTATITTENAIRLFNLERP